MAKLQEAERVELKGAICRIAHVILDIDTRMKPTLRERIDVLPEGYTIQQLQDMYDQYIEDVAEEYIQRIEK